MDGVFKDGIEVAGLFEDETSADLFQKYNPNGFHTSMLGIPAGLDRSTYEEIAGVLTRTSRDYGTYVGLLVDDICDRAFTRRDLALECIEQMQQRGYLRLVEHKGKKVAFLTEKALSNLHETGIAMKKI